MKLRRLTLIALTRDGTERNINYQDRESEGNAAGGTPIAEVCWARRSDAIFSLVPKNHVNFVRQNPTPDCVLQTDPKACGHIDREINAYIVSVSRRGARLCAPGSWDMRGKECINRGRTDQGLTLVLNMKLSLWGQVGADESELYTRGARI